MNVQGSKVSCVIPTHDRVGMLEEALHCVLTQTSDRISDVIVVDDLSQVSVAKLVERLNGEYGPVVRYVARSGSGGASASRNAGAASSSGEFLAFLDDDDLWGRTHIEDLLKVAETQGVEMAVSGLSVQERDGGISPLMALPSGLSFRDVLARNKGFTGSNFLVRRAVFNDLDGFDESLKVSNDKDFIVRYLKAGYAYATSSNASCVHRRHNGPQLTRPNEQRAVGLIQYIAKHREDLSRSDVRYLMRYVHAIKRRTTTQKGLKLWHTLALVALYPPRDAVGKVLPKLRRTDDYRSV